MRIAVLLVATALLLPGCKKFVGQANPEPAEAAAASADAGVAPSGVTSGEAADAMAGNEGSTDRGDRRGNGDRARGNGDRARGNGDR